jgi:hypothetical protein
MTLVAKRELCAFIDEAGQRATTPKSSAHLVLSAVVVQPNLASTAQLLAQLRKDLGRRPGDALHWRNFTGHTSRLHAAQAVGSAADLTVSNVVVCKAHLGPSLPDEDMAYLYTLRFLLERLSWFARDRSAELQYTIAHVRRFKRSKLRQYEARLRAMKTQIEWSALHPRGGRLDQPKLAEALQLADITASATFAAVECDRFGNTEQRYLQELAPNLYRRPPGKVTSYGLKMHPWNSTTKALYPWVAKL